jgi:hypothetical protein
MTIDDIADFCQFTGCRVSLGSADVGFIEIAGTGVQRSANFSRYLSFNELSELPSPKAVVAKASIFRVNQDGKEKTLDREQFQTELKAFQKKVEID